MRAFTVMLLVVITGGSLAAQESGPALVVPVPPLTAVRITIDSFTAPDGTRREFEVVSRIGARGAQPWVIFANAGGPAVRQLRGYHDWSRLVTTRGFRAVLYDGPSFDPAKSVEENTRWSVSHLDSLSAALTRRAGRFGIDPERLVMWAGSAQAMAGTPFALSGTRRVRGYVLYYGTGVVDEPRIDVPVFVARAGLDGARLNRDLDSLAIRLNRAGVYLTLVNNPAGSHGFDVLDSTAITARIIAQTLDFMVAVVTPALRADLLAGAPMASAYSAYSAQRWEEAERLYTSLAARHPGDRGVALRLGLSQLANDHPGPALASFDRAKALGQGGARDIGLPAIRAAVRAKNNPKAVEWARWALTTFPRIRAEIAADAELATILDHPEIK